MPRRPIPPLTPGWVIVDGLPVYHRACVEAGAATPAIVHVHGFGISGTYLEPTAALLAPRYRTFVPDLPGMGRSMRPAAPLDLPALAHAVDAYCDAVGIEQACFVGNSLGCPILCEVAARHPDRVSSVVLVSPAGGPNNQPMSRAVMQMALDGPREPAGLLPIAVGDYLRFGLRSGWALFKAMAAFPTLDRVRALQMPTLVVAGRRDPLVRIERVGLFSGLPHVRAVVVPGAHALNFSSPAVVAALVEAHLTGAPLVGTGPLDDVVELTIPPA